MALTLPDIGGSLGQWGTLINGALSSLDGRLGNVEGAGYVTQAGLAAATTTVGSGSLTGTSYTLTNADVGRVTEITAGSAITVTIPNGTLPIGAVVVLHQASTGQITVVGASGVVLLVPGAVTPKTRVQYSEISLRQRASNAWVIGGDLA